MVAGPLRCIDKNISQPANEEEAYNALAVLLGEADRQVVGELEIERQRNSFGDVKTEVRSHTTTLYRFEKLSHLFGKPTYRAQVSNPFFYG